MHKTSTLRIAIPLACAALAFGSVALAHNGEVNLIFPVDQAPTVDGDLSDWPASAIRWPVARVEYGDALEGTGDCRAFARVAYEKKTNALFVGLEVIDDSIVVTPGETRWHQQDGCAIFLAPRNSDKESSATQIDLIGEAIPEGPAASRVCERAARRSPGRHVYEIAIDVARLSPDKPDLHSKRVLGFDIAVYDSDADGSFSWVSWGPGTNKAESSARLGDLVLSDQPELAGRLRGSVNWRDTEDAVARATVSLRSKTDSALRVRLRTDEAGGFDAELPAGQYDAALSIDGSALLTHQVTVATGTEAVVELGPTLRSGDRYPCPPGAGPTPIRFARTGVDWRLLSYPRFDVLALAQTPDGILWTGTRRGLIAYDGRGFLTVFGPPAITRAAVTSLVIGHHDELWIGSERGLLRRDDENLYHYHRAHGMPNSDVRCLLQDRDGLVWIGSPSGLAQFDGRRFRDRTPEHPVLKSGVNCLLEDEDGTVWIGTNSGALRFDVEGRLVAPDAQLGRVGPVLALAETDSVVWIGTSEGLVRFDGSDLIRLEAPAEFTERDEVAVGPWTRTTTLYTDRRGRLWASCGRPELWRFGGKRWRRIAIQDGLHSDAVFAMLEDRDGRLWIGRGAGMSQHAFRDFVQYRKSDGLASDSVFAFVEDRDGVYWFGTDAGLTRYDGRRFETYTKAEGLLDNQIRELFEDSNGTLWIATPSGLNAYDGGTFRSLTPSDGLAGQSVWAIAEDDEHALWFGTATGLSRYRDGRFTNFTTAEGLVHDDIRCLLVDRENSLWVGTHAGLSRYDGERFQNSSTRNGLLDNRVDALCQDLQGRIWLASPRGVTRSVGTKIHRVAMTGHSVVTDHEDHLWIGSRMGVRRYDGRASRLLSTEDGLPARHVTGLFVDRRKNVWIACAESGIARYSYDTTHPLVSVTAVVTDRRHVGKTRVSMLSTQPLVAFECRGISSKTRQEAMLYRYRLRGLSQEWQYTHADRIEYGDLPAGSYQFEAQLIDRDLEYSDVATVDLEVERPYGLYGLWAALGAAALGLLWLGAGIVWRNRALRRARDELEDRVAARTEELTRAHRDLTAVAEERRQAQGALQALSGRLIHAQEEERSRIARELHDDLNQSLSLLAVELEMSLRSPTPTPQELADRLAHLAGRVKELSSDVHRLAHELHPAKLERLGLGPAIRSLCREISAQGALNVEYTAADMPNALSPQVALCVYRIAQEAVGNVVKHSGATEARVRLSANDRELRLLVDDAGVGFDVDLAARKAGIGLVGIEERLRLVNGEVSIRSRPGRGTTVEIRVPIGEPRSS